VLALYDEINKYIWYVCLYCECVSFIQIWILPSYIIYMYILTRWFWAWLKEFACGKSGIS
jgi:hypothetical protein